MSILNLQGKEKTVIEVIRNVDSFKSKLNLWMIQRRNITLIILEIWRTTLRNITELKQINIMSLDVI